MHINVNAYRVFLAGPFHQCGRQVQSLWVYFSVRETVVQVSADVFAHEEMKNGARRDDTYGYYLWPIDVYSYSHMSHMSLFTSSINSWRAQFMRPFFVHAAHELSGPCRHADHS